MGAWPFALLYSTNSLLRSPPRVQTRKSICDKPFAAHQTRPPRRRLHTWDSDRCFPRAMPRQGRCLSFSVRIRAGRFRAGDQWLVLVLRNRCSPVPLPERRITRLVPAASRLQEWALYVHVAGNCREEKHSADAPRLAGETTIHGRHKMRCAIVLGRGWSVRGRSGAGEHIVARSSVTARSHALLGGREITQKARRGTPGPCATADASLQRRERRRPIEAFQAACPATLPCRQRLRRPFHKHFDAVWSAASGGRCDSSDDEGVVDVAARAPRDPRQAASGDLGEQEHHTGYQWATG